MLLFSPAVQTLFFSFTGEGDDKIQELSTQHPLFCPLFLFGFQILSSGDEGDQSTFPSSCSSCLHSV